MNPIKTTKGLAEPLPLSDIQENTVWTQFLTWVVGLMAMIMALAFIYILWLTNYTIKHDVVGNVLRSCVK